MKRTTQTLGTIALALGVACGGEEEPGASPGQGSALDGGAAPVVVGAGGSSDATVGGLDASSCILGVGAACRLANGSFGYRQCANGVPIGDCMSLIPEAGLGAVFGDGGIASFLDGGFLRDTGVGFADGSLTFGDASFALPEAGTLKCPAGYMCSTTLGALFPGISACTKEGGDGLFPDVCMTPGGACKTGTANGTCQNVLIGNYCITPCN